MSFIVANEGLERLAGPVTVEELRGFGDAWDSLWDQSAVQAHVLVCGEATSALDVLKELCLAGKIDLWSAVWVTTQTAGRGQFRKPWVSLPGNLHAAWRWPLIEAPGDDLIPLGVGLAVARALGRFGVPATLKWPNDILLGQRKLGGLLVERYLDFVLVGLGLNLGAAPGPEQLDSEVEVAPTCLAEHGLAFDLGSFWDELCDEGRLVATKLGTEAGREELRAAHSRLLARDF